MEANIEIAQMLFKQSKYQETIDTCNEILTTDNNSIEAIKLIAKSFLATRKIDDARLYFNKALNIQSNDYEVIKDLGNTYQAVGDVNNAINYYIKAIEINSSYAPALTNLGSIIIKTGNKQDALALLIQATKSDPLLAPAWGNLANGYVQLGKIQEAEISCRKSIEINPNIFNSHFLLGRILIWQKKLIEAEQSLRKTIELKPDFLQAHLNLGAVLKDLGNLEEAESLYRKIIEIKPDYADAHSNLGNIFFDLGNLEEAESLYRKAIEIKPDFADAHYNLGNILKSLGKLQEAELSYRKTIEINPNFAEANYNLGNILNDLGKSQEALRHWVKAAEIKPQNDLLVIGLAHNLCFRGNYELALKYLIKNKSNSSQSVYLGCLLSLNREQEFNEKYKLLSEKKVCNANIGGIVEHANIIYENQYESSFCNEAINYVLIDKINEELFSENHLNQLISYNRASKKANRAQGLLENGIQTSGNLFSLDFPFIKEMKKALEIKIDKYKQKFKHSGQGFINNWPENYDLRSWMITMKTGGFLKPHNHEYGWITGSFYLQIPKYNKNSNKDAGNIAFSYQGPRYPNKNKNFNLTIKKIETRDICIFPSSLFHHTIPFKSTEDRICFVFDLVQK